MGLQTQPSKQTKNSRPDVKPIVQTKKENIRGQNTNPTKHIVFKKR